jgi:hypothetical protein
MLDIYGRAPSEHGTPIIHNPEFFRVELAPLADGKLFVSLIATTVDDEEPQLLEQEIASDRVATIDDVLAHIRTHVRFAQQPSRKEH